jgi:predicted DNA binding protein
LRELFEITNQSPVVVVPPIEYVDGTVSYSVYGPADDIQAAIDAIPDPISVAVTEISGLKSVPGVLESLLTDRQREAVKAALSLGYYDVPRSASHEAVAEAMDCAPSTAAEHLRKAESKLLRSMLGRE